MISSAALLELRAVIVAGGPDDDAAARRLAQNATGFLGDPAAAERLQTELATALDFQMMVRALGGQDEQLVLARRDALEILDRIEAAAAPSAAWNRSAPR